MPITPVRDFSGISFATGLFYSILGWEGKAGRGEIGYCRAVAKSGNELKEVKNYTKRAFTPEIRVPTPTNFKRERLL